MEIEHLSPSSIKLFLDCPAQWRARYIDGGMGMSGAAADRGTAIHLALERFIDRSGHLIEGEAGLKTLLLLFAEAWDEVIGGPRETLDYKEGEKMLRRWWDRQDWEDRTVISTEQKTEFWVNTHKKPTKYVYIIDRLDQTASGETEVIDYKSGRYMLNHEQLREDPQALTYAVAVWLLYPDQARYWVTFDYLQGDPIGVAFTPEQCLAYYTFLGGLADRVEASDGSEERLNPKCRFCDRKLDCSALARHMAGGGFLGTEQRVLVSKRVELTYAAAAIDQSIKDIDGQLVPVFEKDDTLEALRGVDPEHEVTLGSSSRRWVDMGEVRKILGPDELADHSKVSIKDLENIAMEMAFEDPELAAALRRAIKPGRTRPAIRIIAPSKS